jgi:voltage-gated potassium channel
MYHKLKKDVHILLHPELGDTKWDKIINGFIILLIVLNITAVMLETVQSIHDKYKDFFDYFDLVSVIIFTVEYVLRVWSCNHDPKYKHSVKGRLKYMLSWGALIDLIAFLPYYLHRIIGFDLRILRVLRLLRFFRLFRLTAYMTATKVVVNVFRNWFNELMLSLILTLFLIIIASCLVYFAEHLQPDTKFTSIPATIWWAVVSLTTVGYGDMIPVTVMGKIFASLILLAGVALLALPAGIITVGFLEEMRKSKKPKIHKCPHCGGNISHLDLHDDHHHH